MQSPRSATPVDAVLEDPSGHDQQDQREHEQDRAPVEQLDARHHPEAGDHPFVGVGVGPTALPAAVDGEVEPPRHHRERRGREERAPARTCSAATHGSRPDTGL